MNAKETISPFSPAIRKSLIFPWTQPLLRQKNRKAVLNYLQSTLTENNTRKQLTFDPNYEQEVTSGEAGRTATAKQNTKT